MDARKQTKGYERHLTSDSEDFFLRLREAIRLDREDQIETARKVSVMVGKEIPELIFDAAIAEVLRARPENPFGYFLTFIKFRVPDFVETQKRLIVKGELPPGKWTTPKAE